MIFFCLYLFTSETRRIKSGSKKYFFFLKEEKDEKGRLMLFFFFTKFDQLSRVGSRDRHTGWRSKIRN